MPGRWFAFNRWKKMCNPEATFTEAATLWDVIGSNLGVLAFLLLVSLMLVVLFAVDRSWRRRQNALEETCEMMMQSYEYALHLVRHFLPSLKVEKYQFRGMRAKSTTVDIDFEDLSLELPNGARVLKGVTGTFKGGRMCAVMGPSGAGKTTFMNVLCGKATYGKMAGKISINGKEADISQLKTVLGFVPQDDIVHEDLTVREQIQFSAELRNAVNTSEDQIERITDDVLHVMQIDHIQNSIVGGVEHRGISGGQRKRVNIGLEVAAQPSVLFLDEPTSGLDSTSSLAVALSLKKMCQLGMTSIMVIHQPRYSLFTLFDDVLLLGKGGQTVYLGPSLGAKAYFESLGFTMEKDENPADWFMDIISGEIPNEKIPDFKPQMLFDLWKEKGEEATRQGPAAQQLGRRGSRLLNEQDDAMILAKKLEEEWNRIDSNRDGVMDETELRSLLAQCTRMKPCDKAVHEIFMRMAGSEAKVVTKGEFVDYLCSLRGDVANDRLVQSEDVVRKKSSRSNKTDTSVSDASEASSSGGDIEKGSPSKALAELQRVVPCFLMQLHILLRRRLIQWWRKNQQRALFLAALSVGAVVLGVMDRFILKTPRWDASSFVNTHTALALLVCIFCLQVFGNDRPVFWRECASGMSVRAFFTSRIWINTFDLFLLTSVFTGIYFVVRQPFVPFATYLLPFLLVTYVASGYGYLISTLLPPQHGPFVASLVIFVICGLMGTPMNLKQFLNGTALEFATSMLSITRWSVAMSFTFVTDCTQPQPTEKEQQYLLTMENAVYQKGAWGVGLWWTATFCLLIMGTVLRALAVAGLLLTNRDKRV
jgi:ABC-type multidrug transport system ATPase subunit